MEKAPPAREGENERLEGSMDEGTSPASSDERDESSAARASGSDGEKEESALSETKGGEGEQAGAKPSEPPSNAPRGPESHEEATGSAKDDTADNELPAGTLLIRGATIPYVDVRGGTTPSSGGGLWLGSDAVDDGSWGYFVGHNPGSFAPVRSLSLGDVVTVCDRRGAQRTYVVRDVFQVEETATWKTIASRVTGYGESVVLQTCAGNGRNIIAVAA
ncbi:sortase domain-containing protein [Adlercreutzia shanghongiae]|uniref:Sortase n=1 Tax=Adlercreutzia shanghongiae TaxID=3111773 RepID=A0ABU6IYQ0_9ACTN|nr:sortase [Adlercreutzia sp. R22]MEC4294986.1 sortase [Adlercreutzia sp. R22]